MCGITGIINSNSNPVDDLLIEKMNNLASHRGPDSFGYYHGPGLAFGHRRLAILDLTEHGQQPMTYREKFVIVYNGEVYNYLEVRDELRLAGHDFHTHTDTEVILASYAQWGFECVHHFNGMWAFALYDSEKKIIFCSRDRFGVKPFYYYRRESPFAFASEIKQFTALDEWRAELNKERAADFLINGIFDHTEETMFRGVYQLRGGCNLVYNLATHSYSIARWYDISSRMEKTELDFEVAKKKFHSLFLSAVRLRLRSDVQVGSCLSGGLDSSAIVCAMNDLLREQNAHDRQETVSSCFTNDKYDEQPYIDLVIEKTCASNHKVFPLYDELFRDLDKILYHQDEPFVSTSIFAQWSVFRAARENGLIVMLDGQGADEQLAGYHFTFFGAYFVSLIKRFRFMALAKELNAFRKLYTYSIFYTVKVIAGAVIPKYILNLLLKVKYKSFVRLTNTEIISCKKSKKSKKSEKSEKYNRSDVTNQSLVEILVTPLPMLLHYEDRNSMAHSVESRVPFLDYRLVEFVTGLPDKFKIKSGVTKYIMREALRGQLPEKIVQRYDKMGFVTPEDVWMKENREDFRKELADAVEMSKGLIRKEILEKFDNYLLNKERYDYIFWRIIIFGRWLKLFKVTII